MIELIISDINNRLEPLGLFSKKAGICEIITKQEKSFPAEYCLNEYKQISDFDYKKGVLYHRLTGVSISESLDQSGACDIYKTKEYFMRLVVTCKKDVYKKANNDAYIDLKIAENIENAITFTNNKALRTSLGVDSVSVSVNKIDIDRYNIFKQEYSGMDMFIDFEWAYIALDYTISISADANCFKLQEC